MKAEPCVFRKVAAEKLDAMPVVRVDKFLVLTVTKETVEDFLGKLQSRFTKGDLGEAAYYIGRHIIRDRTKGELE